MSTKRPDTSLRKRLEAVFDADRALRRAEIRLLKDRTNRLPQVLAEAAAEAEKLPDLGEGAARLARLCDLCAQVPGTASIDILLGILDHEDPAVRVQAAEALVDVGCERYDEVAKSVTRALEAGAEGPAMQELPWVIAEIAEPDADRLIAPFLAHQSADVVASAIEVLASLATPAALEALDSLKDDCRQVELEELEGQPQVAVTIGELVKTLTR